MEIVVAKSIEEQFNSAQLTDYIHSIQFNVITWLEISGSRFEIDHMIKMKNVLEQSKTINTLILNRDSLTDAHLIPIIELFQMQQTIYDKRKKITVYSNPSSVQVISGTTVYHIANGYIKLINLAWNQISEKGHDSMNALISTFDVFGTIQYRTK